MPLLEVCVESIARLREAQSKGAGRIELCSRLDLGGLSPGRALLGEALAIARVPVHAMVRPRGGDFAYSAAEFARMERDIEEAKGLGAAAVVLGILATDRRVDVPRTKALVLAARPMSVTFHRAFDEVADPFGALEELIEAGVGRVLTAGGRGSAFDGRRAIRALLERARGRIVVMAGGGIRAGNVGEILAESGVSEVHSSAIFPLPDVR
ncbi:MAG: copper homeostasis protein CutC [Planctomycetota bacterium]